jgi:hypothetical protein
LNARLSGLQASAQPFAQPATHGYAELFKVLVDPETGQIIIDVDGQQFETIKQVKERQIGQRILETVSMLLKFTGGVIATVDGMKSIPIPNAHISEMPSSQPATPATPTMENKAGTYTESQNYASVPQPDPTPNRSDLFKQARDDAYSTMQPPAEPAPQPGGIMGRLRRPAEPLPLPSFNLAEEIDKVVQQKLIATGESTPVKIDTGLGGHLRIKVGNQYFSAVDEVEPSEIREMIKSSIRDWERR